VVALFAFSAQGALADNWGWTSPWSWGSGWAGGWGAAGSYDRVGCYNGSIGPSGGWLYKAHTTSASCDGGGGNWSGVSAMFGGDGSGDPYAYNGSIGVSTPSDVETDWMFNHYDGYGTCFDFRNNAGGSLMHCDGNTGWGSFMLYPPGSCCSAIWQPGYTFADNVFRTYVTSDGQWLYVYVNGSYIGTYGIPNSDGSIGYVQYGNNIDLSTCCNIPPPFHWSNWQTSYYRIFQDAPTGGMSTVNGIGVGNGSLITSNNPNPGVAGSFGSSLSYYYGGAGAGYGKSSDVQSYVNGSGWFNVINEAGASGSSYSFGLGGLHGANTVYERFLDADGNTDYSQTGGTHYIYYYVDTAAPPAPGTPSAAEPTLSTLRASWGAVSDNADSGGSYGGGSWASGVAAYQVEWFDTGTSGTGYSGAIGCCSWTFSGTANHSYQFRVQAEDNVGNWGPWSGWSAVIQMDDTPPITTIIPGGTAGNGGWWKASSVTLSCADNSGGSGCKTTFYKIDSGGTNTYAAPFPLSDGIHAVNAWSVDNAGNTESPGSSTTIKVDATSPSTTLTINPGVPTGSNGWYKTTPTGTVSCTDATSGCSSSTYTIYGGAPTTYSTPFSIPDGNGNVQSWSVDMAGNTSFTQTAAVKVDTVAPGLAAGVSPASPDGTNGWYKTNPTFTTSCADGTSGCWFIQQVVNGISTNRSGAGPFSVGLTSSPSTQTVTFQSNDNAGNTSGVWSWSGKVDSTPPALNVTFAPNDGGNGWWITPPTWTATCADAESACPSGTPITYTVNAGAPVACVNPCVVPVSDGTYAYQITALNGSGLTTTQSYTFKVDDGAFFNTGVLMSPGNGTTYCTPAVCSEIVGGTALPTPLTFSWSAASDTCTNTCAGIGGYWIVISKHSDLSSPVVSSNVGNVTSYSGFTPSPDSTYFWDVQAYTNAAPSPGTINSKADRWQSPQNGSSSPTPWSFTWASHNYQPPTVGGNICIPPNNQVCSGAIGRGWFQYPTGGVPFQGVLHWLVGRPLDVTLSAIFSGANQYGSCSNCPVGWSATSATVVGFHYYPPTSGTTPLPPMLNETPPPLVSRLDQQQGWSQPGAAATPLPSSCPVGSNPRPAFLICYTIDVQVTFQDGSVPPNTVQLVFSDVPHASEGKFIYLPSVVDYPASKR